MKSQMASTGFMPRNIAIALLTSPHSKTNGFRKRCLRAMERVCEPVSRSTALPVSAPKTYEQRLIRKLRKLNAKQLCTWARRIARKGNRLQDARNEAEDYRLEDTPAQRAVETLSQHIEMVDTLGQAIQSELTKRANGGKVAT